MGCCASAEQNQRQNGGESKRDNTNQIDSYLNHNEKINERTISLLLLGPGGSGKSTVIKQMQKIYDGHIPKETLVQTAKFIKQKNIIQDIFDLCKINSEMEADNVHEECRLQSLNSRHIFESFMNGDFDPQNTELTPDLASQLMVLWKDQGMRATFDIRKKSHIMDNTPYFFDHLMRIAEPDYVATFEDYIRVRHRTVGISETSFDIVMDEEHKSEAVPNKKKNNISQSDIEKMWRFKFTDVGGQRTERKKWVKCFSDIHAIIYVMSLAGYDQVLFEDHRQNCVTEAFDVFESTVATPALAKVDIITFLNKNDLFETKILEVPFTVFDANFDENEAHNSLQVVNYIKQEFRKRYNNRRKRVNAADNSSNLYFHVTSATDTSQIATVMTVIQLQQIRNIVKQMDIFL